MKFYKTMNTIKSILNQVPLAIIAHAHSMKRQTVDLCV